MKYKSTSQKEILKSEEIKIQRTRCNYDDNDDEYASLYLIVKGHTLPSRNYTLFTVLIVSKPLISYVIPYNTHTHTHYTSVPR